MELDPPSDGDEAYFEDDQGSQQGVCASLQSSAVQLLWQVVRPSSAA